MQGDDERTPPDWHPEGTAAFWINRTSRSLLRRHESRLRPLGFGMSHLPVLLALNDAGALSQKKLAELARVEQSTMAVMLARMERDGIIERETDPDDKRASLISLTRKARTRLSKGKAALMEGEREATAGLSEDEKRLLVGLLRRVAFNVEEGAGGDEAVSKRLR